MLALAASGLSLPQWQPLVVAIIGVGSAVLMLLVGIRLTRSRRTEGPARKEETKTEDPFVHGSATEKRTSLRRRGNPVKVVLTDEEATTPPEEAWVLDRSMGGLRVQVDRKAVAVGTILNVRPVNGTQTTPWIKIEVKSCHEQDDGCELGCRFLKTPSWSVLLLFG